MAGATEGDRERSWTEGEGASSSRGDAAAAGEATGGTVPCRGKPFVIVLQLCVISCILLFDNGTLLYNIVVIIIGYCLRGSGSHQGLLSTSSLLLPGRRLSHRSMSSGNLSEPQC